MNQWYGHENLSYSPEVKYPEIFINPRTKYMAEVLRQMSVSYKRIVAVVDSDMLDSLEQSWAHLPRDLVKLNSLLHVPKNVNGLGLKDKLNTIME